MSESTYDMLFNLYENNDQLENAKLKKKRKILYPMKIYIIVIKKQVYLVY
jgi:hypothetical protein